jgi:hypothetical protein
MGRVGRCIVGIDMTGGTGCRGPAEAIRMTSTAQHRCVSTGEREPCIIMIEGSVNTSGRMTCITGDAVVFIATNIRVLTVHLGLVIVGMAINTAEGTII